MSVVYVVEHVLTGEELALKIITLGPTSSAGAVERFKREARASARIKSEHVVRIIDADVAPELGGAPYLVMDLLEGSDLETAAGPSPLAPSVVLEWLRQVARGVDKAHALGIVHRDLKPENLFLTRREDGRPLVKILDFGIARVPMSSAGTTPGGGLLGTPLYMSPEQARADGTKVTPTADLYSLGLIAFRLLAGRTYWTASTITGLIAQIVYEPMLPPSESMPAFGPAFDAWFAKACHRDPAQRFGSASMMIESLAEALKEPTLETPPPWLEDVAARQSDPSGDQAPFAQGHVSSRLSGSGTSGEVPTINASVYTARPPAAHGWWMAVVGGAGVLTVLALIAWWVLGTGYRGAKVEDRPSAGLVIPSSPTLQNALLSTSASALMRPPAVARPTTSVPTVLPVAVSAAPSAGPSLSRPPSNLPWPASRGPMRPVEPKSKASNQDPLSDQK